MELSEKTKEFADYLGNFVCLSNEVESFLVRNEWKRKDEEAVELLKYFDEAKNSMNFVLGSIILSELEKTDGGVM